MSDILLSSPDPLNASYGNSSTATSYSKRITRSQQPQRFASIPNSSPRKQTFELDVGNKRSPQKILVTVEAEGEGSDKENNVSRRLFQSPAPRFTVRRRRETTTTTTVPLRGLTDDEGTGAATPRKRGRPRRSGTPTPAARKRARTPIQRTPKRAKKTSGTNTGDTDASLVAPSSVSVATSRATPRSVGRLRKTPRGKSAAVPASSTTKASVAGSAQPPKKRGRPRRQALAPEDIEALAEEKAAAEEVFEQSTIVVQTPSLHEEQDQAEEAEELPQYNDLQEQNDDDGDDIWMANLSEPPTPVPRLPPRREDGDTTAPEVEPDEVDIVPVAGDHVSEADTVDDAGLFMELDDKSDAASQASEVASINSRAQDTVANGEDFSMIHIDSSFHANSSMRRENEDVEDELSEMGDMTSLVVSRTLASLRQEASIDQEVANEAFDHVDEIGDQAQEDAVMDEQFEPQASEADVEQEQEYGIPDEDPERTPVPASSQRNLGESSVDRPLSAGPLFSQAPSPQAWTRSPRRNRTTPLGRQLALKSLQNTPALEDSPQIPSLMLANKDRVQADSPQAGAEDVSMLYEDSFSEIPAAVLEAATPRHYRRRKLDFAGDEGIQEHQEEVAEEVLEDDRDQQQGYDHESQHSEEDDAQEQLSEASPLSGRSLSVAAASGSDGYRLPTPDQTPPESEDHPDEVEHTSSKSFAASAVASSPPVVKRFVPSRQPLLESFRQHARNRSTETPLAAMLSPQVAPPLMAGDIVPLDNLMVPPTGPRPVLSPIVRAGRALQSVTSDPPSPKDRESLLGSPFRSSTGRRTVSPAESPKALQRSPRHSSPVAAQGVQQEPSSPLKALGSWSKSAFAPLTNLVAQGAQVFSSPRQSIAPPTNDPFGPDLQNAKSDEFVLFRAPSVSPELQNGASARNESFASSTRVAPPTADDEMDWEAEPIAPRAQPEGASFNSISSTGATRDSAPDMEASLEQVTHRSHSDREATVEVEEEEDDIWANEASRIASQKSNKTYQANVEPPRRPKLPSPWRKNSWRFTYRDELSKPKPSIGSASADASQLEYSLLSTTSATADDRAAQRKVGSKPLSRVDLSSFFSSPAEVPQPAMPLTGAARIAAPKGKENQKPVSRLNQSMLGFEQEKSVVEPPTPRQGLFLPTNRSLFSSSIAQKSATKLQTTGDVQSSVPQKGFQMRSTGRRDLFSPVKPQKAPEPEAKSQESFGNRSRADSGAASTAPSTPEQPNFAVPQKQNFTPVRELGTSLFQPRSSTAPVPALAPQAPAASTQASSDPFTDDENIEDIVNTSHISDDSSFIVPQLKPLPDKLASPSKSCIRSPLKPKTPGRVVEFGSDTLSPLAQAQARAERSELASWGQDFSASKMTQQPSAHAVTAPVTFLPIPRSVSMNMDVNTNKENAPASPTKSKQPIFALPMPKFLQPQRVQQVQQQQETPDAPSPLAQGGAWTRAHWVRLDEILQQHRQRGPLNFQLAHPVASSPGKNRRSAALLGKQVLAQGESMVLEQWHLDVVDAYKAEVGGWEESVLAKRLFALLVGEERRSKGLVPKNRVNRVK